MLEVYQANFFYGGKQVLHDINLKIERGEIIAFLGPNGSGKSTLLRCMAGLYSPTAGLVKLDQKDIANCNRKILAQHIALLPQTPEMVNYISVRDLVARGRSPYQAMGWTESVIDQEKVDWALQYMGLVELKNRPLNQLSGGERQRSWIAMVIAQDTDYILLDEPVNCLDIKYQWNLLKIVTELREKFNKTFILVFHDINHALQVANRVFVFKEGHVYREGKVEEIITPALIQEVYGVCTKVCRFSGCAKPIVVPLA